MPSAPVPEPDRRETAEELEERLRALTAELTAERQRALAVEREQRARIRELEQAVSALLLGLSETRADVERAEASRAWRLGHRFTRMGRILARRSSSTGGAMRAALERIEVVEQQVRAQSRTPAASSLPGGRSVRRPPRRTVDDAEREAGRRVAGG